MKTKLFIKKNGKTLGAVLTVVEIILKILGMIPPIASIILLSLIGIFWIPLVWNYFQIRLRKWLVTTALATFLIGLAYYFFQENLEHNPGILVSNTQKNHIITGSNNKNEITIGTQTNESIVQDDHSVKNSTLISAQYAQNGNGNTMNISHYNLPQQRHVINEDIVKLKSIQYKEHLIKVLYPADSTEAAKYAEEIKNKLFDLGFKTVALGFAKTSSISSKKRFEIANVIENDVVNIIINPLL